MRNLLLLTFALLYVPSPQTQETSSVVVVSYKWSKSRQVMKKTEPQYTAPAPGMIPQNKKWERDARVNNPTGAREPLLDSTDGRSAAIEKNVQESLTLQPKPVDGFKYEVKVQNATAQGVDILFWEYQFIERANPQNVTRRQFLCAVNIKAGKEKEILAFSPAGSSEVVSVDTLAKNSANQFEEKVLINRVEYSDGSIWQRKDWKFGEIREGYRRATATPWSREICRGL